MNTRLLSQLSQTMNILKKSAIALTTCVLSAGIVFVPQPAQAQDYGSFNLTPGFLPDPQIGTGLSGGGRSTSDCGYVGAADSPDHVLTVNGEFSYLRAFVEAPGDVTLLVEGPDGRYCSDDVNGLMPEIAGSWPSGTYYIWIGDFAGPSQGTHRYQLFLSEYSE
jgi:hypothetical protein